MHLDSIFIHKRRTVPTASIHIIFYRHFSPSMRFEFESYEWTRKSAQLHRIKCNVYFCILYIKVPTLEIHIEYRLRCFLSSNIRVFDLQWICTTSLPMWSQELDVRNTCNSCMETNLQRMIGKKKIKQRINYWLESESLARNPDRKNQFKPYKFEKCAHVYQRLHKIVYIQ